MRLRLGTDVKHTVMQRGTKQHELSPKTNLAMPRPKSYPYAPRWRRTTKTGVDDKDPQSSTTRTGPATTHVESQSEMQYTKNGNHLTQTVASPVQ